MKNCISFRELDELGEGIVRRYLERSGAKNAEKCIDIVGIANDLGLSVVYEHFAEKDMDKIGFLSDGKTALMIRRDGQVVSFLFPLGTIVLDSTLHADNESGRCRFTIAHEVSHFIIDRHRPAARFHREFEAGKNYTIAELSDHFNMVESQADRLASALLMPRFTVDRALADFHEGQSIPVYGQNVFADQERKVISKMASQIGVSYTALVIRLRQFGLLDYRPVEEYLDRTFPEGSQGGII